MASVCLSCPVPSRGQLMFCHHAKYATQGQLTGRFPLSTRSRESNTLALFAQHACAPSGWLLANRWLKCVCVWQEAEEWIEKEAKRVHFLECDRKVLKSFMNHPSATLSREDLNIAQPLTNCLKWWQTAAILIWCRNAQHRSYTRWRFADLQRQSRLQPWTDATWAEPPTLNTVQVSNEDQTQEVRLGLGTPVVTLIKAQLWSPLVSTFRDAPHSVKAQPGKNPKTKHWIEMFATMTKH